MQARLLCGANLLCSRCFVNCHLAAHQEKAEDRNHNYREICRLLRVCPPPHAVTSYFDYLFFFGDLNYRIDLPRPVVMDLVKRKDWLTADSMLNKADQYMLCIHPSSHHTWRRLHNQRNQGQAFTNFQVCYGFLCLFPLTCHLAYRRVKLISLPPIATLVLCIRGSTPRRRCASRPGATAFCG
jgi:hypothetical protein